MAERDEVLTDLTKKAQGLEAVLDLLKNLGFVPKKLSRRRQVIYKTKFVVRRPRTKKADTAEPVEAATPEN